MQAQTFVHFHKRNSNEKKLLDQYRSKFDKGTRSIKVTPPIKVTPFNGIHIGSSSLKNQHTSPLYHNRQKNWRKPP